MGNIFFCMYGLLGLLPTSGANLKLTAPLEIHLLRKIVTCSMLILTAVFNNRCCKMHAVQKNIIFSLLIMYGGNGNIYNENDILSSFLIHLRSSNSKSLLNADYFCRLPSGGCWSVTVPEYCDAACYALLCFSSIETVFRSRRPLSSFWRPSPATSWQRCRPPSRLCTSCCLTARASGSTCKKWPNSTATEVEDPL